MNGLYQDSISFGEYLFVYIIRYRDVLLRMMTPGHTRLYIVAMYHEDPEFTGPPNCLSDDHIAQLFGREFFSPRQSFILRVYRFNMYH